MKKDNKSSFSSEFYQMELPGNDDFFQLEKSLVYVNENITTLSELQILSDLSSKLSNRVITKEITDILNKSHTLYINNITDNLTENDKSNAAVLIANIIINNPHLERLSLDNNSFSDDDMPIIINAIVAAKKNPFLKSKLQEVHLRNSISANCINEVITKLVLLDQKYSMTLDLDADIMHQLTLKQTELQNQDAHKACESYLNFLTREFILPAVKAENLLFLYQPKGQDKLTRAVFDEINKDSFNDHEAHIGLLKNESYLLAALKYKRIREMQKHLESDLEPAAKKENYDKLFDECKEILRKNVDAKDKTQENLIRRLSHSKETMTSFFSPSPLVKKVVADKVKSPGKKI